MIFDRIDIFVVCIAVCFCLCIAGGFIGNRDALADFVIVTILISEVCYTNRCKEKLEKELDVAANKRCAWRQKLIDLYSLLIEKRNAQSECEHAKLNYCKYKITLEELVSVMNRTDKEISEISDKIVELKKELSEFYK